MSLVLAAILGCTPPSSCSQPVPPSENPPWPPFEGLRGPCDKPNPHEQESCIIPRDGPGLRIGLFGKDDGPDPHLTENSPAIEDVASCFKGTELPDDFLAFVHLRFDESGKVVSVLVDEEEGSEVPALLSDCIVEFANHLEQDRETDNGHAMQAVLKVMPAS